MADAASPALKRKREGLESQRKKAKTQDKSTTEVATPVKSSKDASGIPKPTPKPEASATPRPSGNPPTTPAPATPSSSRKNKKKNKAKKHTADETQGVTEDKDGQQNGGEKLAETESEDHPAALQVTRVKDHKQKKHKEKRAEPWSLSTVQGGWFLPQDPVFSANEQYLLLGKPKALDVYAADTSLRAKEIPMAPSAWLSSYALSAVEPNSVYVSDSSGTITLWDWTSGKKIDHWDIKATAKRMAVVKQPEADIDLVYAYEAGSSHAINVHALRKGEDAGENTFTTILDMTLPVTQMQVLLQGKLVVISTSNSVLIGKRRRIMKTALQDFEYTWRQFEMPRRITTFNAYLRISDADAGKNQLLEQRDHLDLAVGDEEGAIHLFEDVITSFASLERSQNEKPGKTLGVEDLVPKRLHWHRTAVGSVKWSIDGNYLISGGDETVLILWQLSTGKKQHLPHLTAAIEKIVVSPSGTSYGLSLANNSVVVLSTSELDAKTNIAGIQSRRVDVTKGAHLSNLENAVPGLCNPVPMEVDPTNSNHIIFVGPSSQSWRRHAKLCEPYVQTFDISNSHVVTRQAVTRNNATNVNTGPDGKLILEPNVGLLQLSHDGEWMATVDEWAPSRADLAYMEDGSPGSKKEEQKFRREVYLKMWRRDAASARWMLDARIDAPHFAQDVSAHARVFDLIADPSRTGFATVGEDRVIRLWRPKTRLRDGTVVRGADRAQGFVTWSLDRSFKIADKLDVSDTKEIITESAIESVRLAFSADGSVLIAAVSWQSKADPAVIHIIDAQTGKVQRSITEIDTAFIAGIAILGHHLVVVGDSTTVWDIVMDQLVHCIPIDFNGAEAARLDRLIQVAVNEEDKTFAVSVPGVQQNTPGAKRALRASTQILIFQPSGTAPVWKTSIPEVVLALRSLKGEKGFVTLDATSSVRLVRPTVATLQLPTPPPESILIAESMEMDNSDDNEAESSQVLRGMYLGAGDALLAAPSESDKPVVKAEQLQQIFERGPSNALPPVKELFEAVVGLYGRKPRVVAVGQ